MPHREHQRDIDVDPLGNQRIHGLDSLGCGNDFDHQVRTAHDLSKPAGLRQGCRGIACRLRRRLQAHKPVRTAAFLVLHPEGVRGATHVLNYEFIVDLLSSDLRIARYQLSNRAS